MTLIISLLLKLRRNAILMVSAQSVHGSECIVLSILGVLTKADTVQQGEHEQWLNILHNKAHRLTHGYYVTRQLSAEQMRNQVSWSQSRELEREFFLSANPWSKERPERLGTERLIRALSDRLSKAIEERFILI
jgi:hypothetical protein